MIDNLTVNSHIDDRDEFAARLFRGEMLLFAGIDPLIAKTHALLCDMFDTDDPQRAHRMHDTEAFFEKTGEAQRIFNSAEYKKYVRQFFNDIGRQTDGLFWDTLGLRIAPPQSVLQGGFRSSIGAHRDIWGAGIMSQVNWWGPIYPVAANRTMGFYPSYWDKPLQNSSDEWTFRAYLDSRREKDKSLKADYPSAPVAQASPEEAIVPVIFDVGCVLCFSSAHLHASVPNASDLTRFSFEIRTVDIDDVRQDRGAPNVDCASSPPLYQLFSEVDGDRKLRDCL